MELAAYNLPRDISQLLDVAGTAYLEPGDELTDRRTRSNEDDEKLH
jgi:hypothetical protein